MTNWSSDNFFCILVIVFLYFNTKVCKRLQKKLHQNAPKCQKNLVKLPYFAQKQLPRGLYCFFDGLGCKCVTAPITYYKDKRPKVGITKSCIKVFTCSAEYTRRGSGNLTFFRPCLHLDKMPRAMTYTPLPTHFSPDIGKW